MIDFAAFYAAHFRHVARWLRAFGIPASDREDVAQEVFLVARRKLDEAALDGAGERAWLFRIAQRTASDHRRRAWFKNLFSRRRDADLSALEWSGASPAEALERKQARRELERLLSKLSEKKRVALVLFELDGYSGEEIAALLGVAEGTVWRRIQMARKELLRLSKAMRAEAKR